MTADEFRELAMIYGADLARWPEAARPAAAALAEEPFAAALLADLAALERGLAAADVAEPSPDRVGRAIAATLAGIARPHPLSPGRLLAWLAAGAGGLTASAALGVVLALHGPLASPAMDPIALLVESGDLSLLVHGLGG